MSSLPRILIANDAPDSAQMYARFLAPPHKPEFAMAECALAYDGFEAFEIYELNKERGTPFDLLILDIAMPGRNGFGVAQTVRDTGDRKTKIVFVTNFHKDIENDARAKAVGAMGVWSDAMTCENFRAAVDSILEGQVVEKEIVTEPSPTISEQTVKAIKETKMEQIKKRDYALWATSGLLLAVLGMQLFALKRAPVLYNTLSSINQRLDGAVSTHALPSGYRVNVPKVKSAFKQLKGKNGEPGPVRVTFEFEAKDYAAAASLAQEREVPLYLKITREGVPGQATISRGVTR